MLIVNRVMWNKHITSETSKSRHRTEKKEDPRISRVYLSRIGHIYAELAQVGPQITCQRALMSATPVPSRSLVNYKRSIHKTCTVSNLNINFKIFKSSNINIPYVSSSMHLLSKTLSLLCCQTLYFDTTIKQWDVKCICQILI